MENKVIYRVESQVTGRVLCGYGTEEMYVGSKRRIFRGKSGATSWDLVGILPASFMRRCCGCFRLSCRLLRYEPRGFAIQDNSSMLVSTKEGVFWAERGNIHFRRSRFSHSKDRVYPPITITGDSLGRFLWGEYWMNPDRKPVGIYMSTDNGKTHQLVYEFAAGQIRHIHQVIEDPSIDGYWVLTGDEDNESGIGWLSRDFKDFEWLIHGSQQYRAVVLFPLADHLIYATDTEKDYNFIYLCDRKTGNVKKLQDLPGSCIYGCKFGKWYVVSTSVEHFHKYKTNLATLWVSKNGYDWEQVWYAEKDIWPCKLFQYGSIVLPRQGWTRDEIVFSGQALKGIDNKVFIAEIVE